MPILSKHPPNWPGIVGLWRAADQLEVFESGWVFDHFSAAAVNATGPCYEAWTTMAALAQVTHRLRIGAMVLAIARRHPALLAQMTLTLDTISAGRIELGLGAGWSEADHGPQGIDLGTPKDRADRLDAGCAALVELLSGRPATIDGQGSTPAAANCDIPSVQRPHPPICIGGCGERRTLRTAARWAQHWNFPGKHAQDFASMRHVLLRYCAEIRRDPTDIIASATVPAGSCPGEAAERAAGFAAAGADLVIFRIRPPYRPSMLERLAVELDSMR
jgi:alkanesulfonate monooxygenase SsuD/methylene tetrahydromethanopterin reductase-like flavin-dependent oxidoreductase (luciferase family)